MNYDLRVRSLTFNRSSLLTTAPLFPGKDLFPFGYEELKKELKNIFSGLNNRRTDQEQVVALPRPLCQRCCICTVPTGGWQQVKMLQAAEFWIYCKAQIDLFTLELGKFVLRLCVNSALTRLPVPLRTGRTGPSVIITCWQVATNSESWLLCHMSEKRSETEEREDRMRKESGRQVTCLMSNVTLRGNAA